MRTSVSFSAGDSPGLRSTVRTLFISSVSISLRREDPPPMTSEYQGHPRVHSKWFKSDEPGGLHTCEPKAFLQRWLRTNAPIETSSPQGFASLAYPMPSAIASTMKASRLFSKLQKARRRRTPSPELARMMRPKTSSPSIASPRSTLSRDRRWPGACSRATAAPTRRNSGTGKASSSSGGARKRPPRGRRTRVGP